MPQLQAASEDSLQGRMPSQQLQEALESVVRKHGFRKPRYAVQPGSGAGDNYLSQLYRVEVTDAEDSSRKLSLMVKGQVASAAVRKSMKTYRAFANEAVYYSEILPAYAKRLSEKGLLEEGEGYPDAPRCLLACVARGLDDDQDVLILQDMRPEGFAMYDRRQGVDLPHCRLVLRALADLHASSFAMECLQPQRFNKIRDSITEMMQDDRQSNRIRERGVFTKYALEMIEKRFPEGSRVHERTRDYYSNATGDTYRVVQPLPEGGNVICHGDCWTNNLLFKYSESGEVERVCLLDFQIARYASPVLDLVYFLYTCTERALRDAHLDSLLHEYHSRLQARMRALGVPDPDAVFSWELMKSHLRQRGRFGLIMGVLVIPLCTASKEDSPDLDARIESVEESRNAFLVKPKDATERDRRVSDLVEEMVDKGYI